MSRTCPSAASAHASSLPLSSKPRSMLATRGHASCRDGSSPIRKASASNMTKLDVATAKAIFWATEPGQARGARSPLASSTTGSKAIVVRSGSRKTKPCSKMPGATGAQSAACRAIFNRFRAGKSISRSRSTKACCSSPTRHCARSARTAAVSSSLSTGQGPISTASSPSTKRMKWAESQAGRARSVRPKARSKASPASCSRTSFPPRASSTLRPPGPPTSTISPMPSGLASGDTERPLPIARRSSARSEPVVSPRWNSSRAI